MAVRLRVEACLVARRYIAADFFTGKSTLQNELIGDLDAEFGRVPDLAEDLPISTLGEILGSSFSGRLGKKSSSLVTRVVSSKLPAGFNQAAVRSHLEQVWNLGPSRQDTVLLFALTAEPSSRLSSTEAAKEWLDSNITRYASYSGLVLTQSLKQSNNQLLNSSINSAELAALRKEQRDFLAKQFSLLATHLEIDPSNDAKISELETSGREMQERLEAWGSEFTEEFELGIKPLFKAQKIRRYRSWWNSVRQDVIRLYHAAELGLTDITHEDISQITLRVCNRLDESVKTLIAHLTDVARARHPSGGGFVSLGKQLVAVTTVASNESPRFRYTSPLTGPKTSVSAKGHLEYREAPRNLSPDAVSYPDFLRWSRSYGRSGDTAPYVHIKSRSLKNEWIFDSDKTERLMNVFATANASGISFAGNTILVTGAGPGSIGINVVKGLLMGGARVIVTTSRSPSSIASFYQNIYNSNGSRGSELLLLPFNQGSVRDCEAVIDHIYNESGLDLNIDSVIPFAAVSEIGIEIDDLGARSELAHRLMMTNVLRIIGRIVKNKRHRRIDTQPTQVILPLSPNHGTFGNDGLYSESKLGLESLLNRFGSEHWSDYVTICGALIGWTRGTGLMRDNDIVAPVIESKGALTFSQHEMAFNIIVLASQEIAQMCETETLLADLNGGLHMLASLDEVMSTARSQLLLETQIQKAVANEDAREKAVLNGPEDAISQIASTKLTSRNTMQIGFPSLPDYDTVLRPLQHLQAMVDPSATIVVVGFSELGPWGSARTRWEMESRAKLSTAGCIELAWMMNLVKHIDEELQGEHYCGWVDVKTGDRVHDNDIEAKYGDHILGHTGIRFMEPELFSDYDPAKKEYLQEVAVEEDLPEFETSEATAQALKLRLGDRVIVHRTEKPDEFKVQVKRGAHILVPKSIPFDSMVAGQIPTGWNPVKYGIPEELVHQVDPVTLYSLCCAAEALYSAGIVDSLEMFKYIHVSEVGNMLGTCMGGTTKTRHMYKDQYLDKQVQGDIIQETYLCASATWINMLLLGASGPIKTPNGTCATGVESLENGCESILSGKTKLCFVGGVDDLQEDEAYGFAKIKATVNTKDEFAKGRAPHEMSRPMTESRAGFVEAQGCGMQLITTAELALEMGLPIYGVIASSTMAADKISRSLPAPGQGLLSFAKETPHSSQSLLLSMDYRREQMQACIIDIERWRSARIQMLASPNPWEAGVTDYKTNLPGSSLSSLERTINATANARTKSVRRLWGNDIRAQDSGISPMRAALAVWGLTVDDIDVVSLHATSTRANDKNELDVINRQMIALGRTPGRPLLAICQKALTGHPKGAAASWMLNGCLQVFETSIVPGNKQADSIDESFREFEHIVFPVEPIQMKEVKAFLLNSFGFGQKGAQMIGVAPKYLFATLNQEAYEQYSVKLTKRKRLASRAWIKAVNSNSVFKARGSTPYSSSDETAVLMDPLARISTNEFGQLQFDGSNIHAQTRTATFSLPSPLPAINSHASINDAAKFVGTWTEKAITQRHDGYLTVGVDVEEIAGFNYENECFIKRNYTETEAATAFRSSNPRAAFAANWSAKEAVFKSLGVKSKGSAAPLKDIEVLVSDSMTEVKVS